MFKAGDTVRVLPCTPYIGCGHKASLNGLVYEIDAIYDKAKYVSLAGLMYSVDARCVELVQRVKITAQEFVAQYRGRKVEHRYGIAAVADVWDGRYVLVVDGDKSWTFLPIDLIVIPEKKVVPLPLPG